MLSGGCFVFKPMCRETRHINSTHLSRFPLKRQCFIASNRTVEMPLFIRAACGFLISTKGFIFEVAVLEDAVANSLQFSFHESLQVICGSVDSF
jgi:hypothetical protein